MSLSEAQQMLASLAEIEDLLTKIEAKSNAMIADLPRTREMLVTFRQLERLALRWLVVAKRMGLPENVDGAINTLARLVVTIRMAHMSINMMMATNPVTAAIGIAGLIGTAMSTTDIMAGY